ncbi:MAG: aminotransferase class V-fold PLP-dependent enzyme [Sandaracinaceae bacterium]
MTLDWQPDARGARLGDRMLFPDLDAVAYLNHGAISPPSTEVRRAVDALISSYAARGVGAFGLWKEQRERLRGRLAALVGGEAQDVALVGSTTQSVVNVAMCFPWERGDRVLCFRGEFPTNVTPWQQAAKTFGLEVVFLDVEDLRTDDGLAKLDRELARGVRLVAVSAVQFQTGLRMPVEAIAARARERGAEVFVDAIQACGVIPVDVEAWGVDYLGCGSHKWLMGLEGAGFLWVRRERQAALVPRLAGWLSHEEPLRFLFEGEGHLRYDRPIRAEPTFLEAGAINGAGFAALEASLALIQHIGVPHISAHVQGYHDALEPGLVERGFVSERATEGRRSGILSLRPPEDVDVIALAAHLGARRVAVTTPDGRLRFAPHWPNDLAEVPEVLDALDDALAELRA